MAREVLCPHCKIAMEYVTETERLGGVVRITRYYRCPACGTKLLDQKVTVKRDAGAILVSVTSYDGKKPVIAVARPRRSVKPARLARMARR